MAGGAPADVDAWAGGMRGDGANEAGGGGVVRGGSADGGGGGGSVKIKNSNSKYTHYRLNPHHNLRSVMGANDAGGGVMGGG